MGTRLNYIIIWSTCLLTIFILLALESLIEKSNWLAIGCLTIIDFILICLCHKIPYKTFYKASGIELLNQIIAHEEKMDKRRRKGNPGSSY